MDKHNGSPRSREKQFILRNIVYYPVSNSILTLEEQKALKKHQQKKYSKRFYPIFYRDYLKKVSNYEILIISMAKVDLTVDTRKLKFKYNNLKRAVMENI